MEILKKDLTTREKLDAIASNGLPNESFQRGFFNKDEEIARKLAFLTQRVQALESMLESQPSLHNCSTSSPGIDQKKPGKFFVEHNYGRGLYSRNNVLGSDDKRGLEIANYSTTSSSGRNTLILIIPNKEPVTRSPAFVNKSQTLLHSSESINQTCHNGSEVENSLQSGSLVNCGHSSSSNETGNGNLLEEKLPQQAQKVLSSDSILIEKDNKKEDIFSSCEYMQKVCLPKRRCAVFHHNNITAKLNKDTNKTKISAQVLNHCVSESYSDESSPSSDTVLVATRFQPKEPGFSKKAASGESALKTISKHKSVQLQNSVVIKASAHEVTNCASQNNSQVVTFCKLSKTSVHDNRLRASTEFESTEHLQPLRQTTGDPDFGIRQNINAIEDKNNEEIEENLKLRVGTKLEQVTKDVTKENIEQNSTCVRELSQYPQQITNNTNLHSSSSDRLTNLDVNSDSLDSDYENIKKGLDKDAPSLVDENDDGKSYSICITRGGEITLMGSDRFTKSEMNYGSVVNNWIDMEMSLSDEHKDGDKKSFEKNPHFISNNCPNRPEVIDLTLKTNCIINSRNPAQERNNEWTSSESETSSPRQQTNHRPSRDSKRKVKITSHEIQTPQKQLVSNYAKMKTCDNLQRRQKSSSERTVKRSMPKVFDFSVEEEQKSDDSDEHLCPEPTVSSANERPLLRSVNPLRERNCGLNRQEDSEVVGKTTKSMHETVERGTTSSYVKYPSKRNGNAHSPVDSQYSSMSSEHDYQIRNINPSLHSSPDSKSGHAAFDHRSSKSNRGPVIITMESSIHRRGQGPNHNALRMIDDQSREQTSRNLSSHDFDHRFLSIVTRKYTSSPVSSVDTSDFSVSDDVFTDCSCSHECQCQTGILTKNDFRDELKSVSHYLLARRQKILSGSKPSRNASTAEYHLDEEEGEMNLLAFTSNTTKEIPLVVKLILKLRKHFYGNFEHQQLSVKDLNNNASSKQSGPALPGTKRISFSPSAMLISAVSESSISEIREVMEKEKVDVNQLSPSGRTLLHKAATAGDIESIHTLVSYGADINLTDQNGFPPLHSAFAHAHYKCAVFLIEQGTDLNQYTRRRIDEYCEVKHMSQRNFDHVLNTYV